MDTTPTQASEARRLLTLRKLGVPNPESRIPGMGGKHKKTRKGKKSRKARKARKTMRRRLY